VDFVEICNVYIEKMIIKAAKRIFNSVKICRSYSDLNFGVTFLEHSVYIECGCFCIFYFLLFSLLVYTIVSRRHKIPRTLITAELNLQ